MRCTQYMVEGKHTTREWDYWLDFQRLPAAWLQDLPRVLGITATPLARGAASSEHVCAQYLCKTSWKSLQDPFGIHTRQHTLLPGPCSPLQFPCGFSSRRHPFAPPDQVTSREWYGWLKPREWHQICVHGERT